MQSGTFTIIDPFSSLSLLILDSDNDSVLLEEDIEKIRIKLLVKVLVARID